MHCIVFWSQYHIISIKGGSKGATKIFVENDKMKNIRLKHILHILN